LKKLVALFAAGAACALAPAALSGAATRATVWTTSLGAAQEVPAQVVKNPNGHGTFKGTLNGTTLTWTLTFAGLTGPAVAAHIHMGAKGVSGNVVVPLCAPCKSPVKGTAKITGSLKSAFAKHNLYVNVHTAKNPNGEIRGQLTVGM
jgi:CHRD domain